MLPKADTAVKIGFACAWKRPPQKTWSGSAWGARTALGRRADVVDLGPEYSAAQTFSKYVHVRRRHGRWVSAYKWSRQRERMVERKLRVSLRQASVDAVVEIGDLAALDVPFYTYVDLSFDLYEKYYDPRTGVPGLAGIDLQTIRRCRERQHRIWESAAGVFAMSRWLADDLIHRSGVPREKVTVVYAGLNSVEETAPDPSAWEARVEARAAAHAPARLLFVGRDFFRKGGDIVVGALAHLRREYSPDIRLTVVGPDEWPLPGNVPDGVLFLGSRPPEEVGRLFHAHDLFVMPSRFEAFGIAFVEALAHGLPVVARSAFAMPEIVRPGENGTLVDGDDPAELASAVAAVLDDWAIRQRTILDAADVRTRFSWDAVAGEMLRAIEDSA
jgi:glycosyltransferase involved in cell wall biosynthesis